MRLDEQGPLIAEDFVAILDLRLSSQQEAAYYKIKAKRET